MNYTTYSAQYGANGTTTGKQQNKPKGNYIETLAAEHLKREGYEILARNYAYRGGELDIVAREGETIVFVEVKSVWNNQQGNPAARTTPRFSVTTSSNSRSSATPSSSRHTAMRRCALRTRSCFCTGAVRDSSAPHKAHSNISRRTMPKKF